MPGVAATEKPPSALGRFPPDKEGFQGSFSCWWRPQAMKMSESPLIKGERSRRLQGVVPRASASRSEHNPQGPRTFAPFVKGDFPERIYATQHPKLKMFFLNCRPFFWARFV